MNQSRAKPAIETKKSPRLTAQAGNLLSNMFSTEASALEQAKKPSGKQAGDQLTNGSGSPRKKKLRKRKEPSAVTAVSAAAAQGKTTILKKRRAKKLRAAP